MQKEREQLWTLLDPYYFDNYHFWELVCARENLKNLIYSIMEQEWANYPKQETNGIEGILLYLNTEDLLQIFNKHLDTNAAKLIESMMNKCKFFGPEVRISCQQTQLEEEPPLRSSICTLL